MYNRVFLACLAAGRYNSGMTTRFVNVDRDAPMLLPPYLRDWVPENDMVHFVIEAVHGMCLTNFRINVSRRCDTMLAIAIRSLKAPVKTSGRFTGILIFEA